MYVAFVSQFAMCIVQTSSTKTDEKGKKKIWRFETASHFWAQRKKNPANKTYILLDSMFKPLLALFVVCFNFASEWMNEYVFNESICMCMRSIYSMWIVNVYFSPFPARSERVVHHFFHIFFFSWMCLSLMFFSNSICVHITHERNSLQCITSFDGILLQLILYHKPKYYYYYCCYCCRFVVSQNFMCYSQTCLLNESMNVGFSYITTLYNCDLYSKRCHFTTVEHNFLFCYTHLYEFFLIIFQA